MGIGQKQQLFQYHVSYTVPLGYPSGSVGYMKYRESDQIGLLIIQYPRRALILVGQRK